jgi:hypothetical protein
MAFLKGGSSLPQLVWSAIKGRRRRSDGVVDEFGRKVRP